MQVSSDDNIREWLYQFALQSVRGMSFNATSVLDCPVASGAVRERVRELCDSNLQRGKRDAAARISGYTGILETLAEEYPKEDPILLLWRVWFEDGQTSLASSDLLGRKPITRQSLAYRCLVKGLYANVANALNDERDRLLSEVHSQTRPITSADVEASRLRVAAALRSWRLRRKALQGARETALRSHRRQKIPHG